MRYYIYIYIYMSLGAKGLNMLPKCVSIMLLFMMVLHYIQSVKTGVCHNSMTHLQYGCTIIRHASSY